MDFKEVRENLTDKQIIEFVKHLGGECKIGNNPNELIFETVCHHSKNEPKKYKLYYYKSSYSFYCYSNCSSIGDIYKLAEHSLGLSPSEASRYVLKFFNISHNLNFLKNKDFDFGFEEEVVFKSVKIEDIEIENLEPIKKQKIMDLFINFHCKEWLKEGISKQTMDKYSIRFSQEQGGIIIPHHNSLGQIVGLRIRNLKEKSIKEYGKYTPLVLNGKMYNHQLSKNLYGLDKNKEAIKKYKKVQVFESEKSVLQSDTMFGENSISVAICGSNFNRYQMKMLLDLGVEEFILCLDKQYNTKSEELLWRKKIERIAKPLMEYGALVTTVWDNLDNGELKHKDSPTDRGIKVFKKLVKTREKIIIEQKGIEND